MLFLLAVLGCGDHSHDEEDYAYILDLQSNVENGAELFNQNCASCHGVNAEGGSGPDLVGMEIGHVVEAIQNGVGYSMPSFPELDDQDIADIYGYLESL